MEHGASSSLHGPNKNPSSGNSSSNPTWEEEECLPITNVIRIMLQVLPPHAQITDDAAEIVQQCVSEFIGFITGEANERCQREHRKTVTAEDLLWAMETMGFDHYVHPLTIFLHRYRHRSMHHLQSSVVNGGVPPPPFFDPRRVGGLNGSGADMSGFGGSGNGTI